MSVKNGSAMLPGIWAIALAILFVFLFNTCEKEDFSPTLTKKFSLVSASNGATCNIKVSLPENTIWMLKNMRLSIVLLLDGNRNNISLEFGVGIKIKFNSQ